MNANPTRAIRRWREGPFCAAAFISAKLRCNLGGLCVCTQPHAGDGNASAGGNACKQAELQCRGRDRGWGQADLSSYPGFTAA